MDTHGADRLVFVGGTVLTGDVSRPRVRALAIEGGRVVALDDEAEQRAGLGWERVDLAGRCAVPGFRDGHCHPLQGGLELLGPPLVGARSLDDLLHRIANYAEANPDLKLISGGGYDPTLAPGGLFDAMWLDRVVPDRPVVLASSDHHAHWVSTVALDQAGIDMATPDPPLGRIVRRPDGTPLGTLLEAAGDAATALIPEQTAEDRRAGLRAALRQMADAGLVFALDAACAFDELDTYLDLARAGELTCRIEAALVAQPGRWQDQHAGFRAARERAAAESAGHVGAGTIKLFADGVIESGTGALLEPYVDAPASCGILNWEPEELTQAVTALDADGFAVHIHAIGDAGIRTALDALGHAIATNPPRDRRPTIAHTQLVHPDDLPRFRALGVVANFEPLWASVNAMTMELTNPRIGDERAGWQYPMGELWRSGARLSFGSDWPVTSMNPLQGLAVAITRQDAQGEPPGGWLPHQRLPLGAALAAYTAGTAYQVFDERQGGVLAVGRRADLCLLDADLTAIDPQEIRSVQVQQTWLGGVRVGGGDA